MKILIALATLTLLASCTMPGAQTPTPATPTKQMAPDAMMPKVETMPKPDTMMPDDKMMTGTMDKTMTPDAMQKNTMMDDKKMSDAMPLPYPSTGAALAPDTLEVPPEARMQKDTTPAKLTGYMQYDAVKVQSALASGQRVALFFHASWCPSCKALDRAITADIVPSDAIIFQVDYDTSTELKRKYGVVTQHTTVVLNADGTEKMKKLGARTVAEVLGQ